MPSIGNSRFLQWKLEIVAALGMAFLLPFSLSAQVTKTEHFDFPGGGVLHLVNSTGELTIEGWDRPEVEITTIKSKHVYETEERDTSGLDRVQITAERRGNDFVITTSFPRYDVFPPPLPFRGTGNPDVEYRIHAPRNSSVIVDHNTGEVHLDNFCCDIRVTVLKGGITLRLPENNTYAIDAKVDSGNIVSDFPGRWHHVPWLLGASYDHAAPGGQKLYLRAGFGDIAILKIRKPPYALPDAKAAN
jgi:hypothetical protein